MFEADAHDAVDAALRFVPKPEWRAAREAIEYAAMMVAGSAESAGVAAWCYELAAMGVPYGEWPELVAQRVHRPAGAGSEAAHLAQANTMSRALGLIDRGEI